jgi:hypothetical protein
MNFVGHVWLIIMLFDKMEIIDMIQSVNIMLHTEVRMKKREKNLELFSRGKNRL